MYRNQCYNPNPYQGFLRSGLTGPLAQYTPGSFSKLPIEPQIYILQQTFGDNVPLPQAIAQLELVSKEWKLITKELWEYALIKKFKSARIAYARTHLQKILSNLTAKDIYKWLSIYESITFSLINDTVNNARLRVNFYNPQGKQLACLGGDDDYTAPNGFITAPEELINKFFLGEKPGYVVITVYGYDGSWKLQGPLNKAYTVIEVTKDGTYTSYNVTPPEQGRCILF